jgi:hypothetical protein
MGQRPHRLDIQKPLQWCQDIVNDRLLPVELAVEGSLLLRGAAEGEGQQAPPAAAPDGVRDSMSSPLTNTSAARLGDAGDGFVHNSATQGDWHPACPCACGLQLVQ